MAQRQQKTQVSLARLTSAGASAVRGNHQRATIVAERQAIRQRGLKHNKPIAFSELAENPLYQRIAAAICPPDLKAQLAELHLDHAARVAGHNSLESLTAHLSDRLGEGRVRGKLSKTFLARARDEAIRGYRQMRHMLAVQDPMNLGLRHTPSSLALSAADETQAPVAVRAYAKPSSLQSSQSPAAYLRHLYRIATGLDDQIGIQAPADSPLHIHQRRPDLAALVLSETHLKQEIATIHLVNEVLEAGLGGSSINERFFPMALPFDESAETSRVAVAQIGAMQLNDVGVRTVENDFPLSPGFRLTFDAAGLLGLTGTADQTAGQGSEIALLTESSDVAAENHPATLQDLFGTSDAQQACSVSRLKSSLDLDFDALAQLLGLYVVQQENGKAVSPADFATVMLGNALAPTVVDLDSGAHVYLDGAALTPPDLRALHYVARLHHATALEFRHLNWLLALPGASAASASDAATLDQLARRHVSKAGLRLLAGFVVYRAAFNLSPEAYAALFGEICPYWRADTVVAGQEGTIAGLEQTEVSFFRDLFGSDATWLHQRITDSSHPVSITDADLAAVVARGLRLSRGELDALVAELDANFALDEALDARGLAAVYRLATVIRMLGWPLLTGLQLGRLLSQQLTADNSLWLRLTAKNLTASETEGLCTAIDQLVGLSRWMKEAELAPEALLALLTATDRSSPGIDETGRNWLSSLADSVAFTLGGAESFRQFESWDTPEQVPVTIPAEDWHAWFVGDGDLYRASGVFLPDRDRSAIDRACRAYLTGTVQVDLALESNAARLERLIARLEQLRDTQAQTLQQHLSVLCARLSAAGAGSLIIWAQSKVHDVLETLLRGADNADAQFALAELRRYMNAVELLALGDIDLWLIAERPQWLCPDAADSSQSPPAPRPLGLEQLFYLQRFSMLQVGSATDAAWLGYLTLVHDGRPDTDAADDVVAVWRKTCNDTLAVLLACPISDAGIYVEALWGSGVLADDLRRIDAVARHARLAEALCVGASELIALKSVSDSSVSGDWTAAAAAARSGLARYADGDHTQAFADAFAEIKRNALVAAYMQIRVAADATLAQTVTDRDTLYQYLLLDVKVTSAVPTSPIVEAMSSLQLYINRALSGLEPGVSFSDRQLLAQQWQIDQQYRLWEANQKLLLYPQNYIEPELRYLTSPEFDELLQAVSGGGLDENSVEASVNAYMAGLARSCDLRLCSLFVERRATGSQSVGDGDQPTNANYHFLAQTLWESGRFFYRRLEADFSTIASLADPTQYLKAMDWSFWQEVSIATTYELFSDVTVCFYRNRYYFSWLELEERKTQTEAGEQVLWRLHPRYMRCDAKALSGPMLTPGLFIADRAGDDSGAQINEAAFQWQQVRPEPDGLYHPKLVTNAFRYGLVDVQDTADAELLDTIFVSFGIASAAADNGITSRSLIQLRISERWADAIFLADEAIDQRFMDAAPTDFRPVHPRPIQEDGLSAPAYVIEFDAPSALLDYTYVFLEPVAGQPRFSLQNACSGGTAARSKVSLSPASSGDASAGTVTAEINLGDWIYSMRTQPATGFPAGSHYQRIRERSGTQLSARLVLSWLRSDAPEGAVPSRHSSDWVKGAGALFSRDIPYVTFDGTFGVDTTLLNNLRLALKVRLPEDWRPDPVNASLLTVRVDVKREFPALTVDYVAGEEARSFEPVCPLVSREVQIDVGTFTVSAARGKTNTAWVSTQSQGNLNFLHLMDHEDRALQDTFVLMNASTALAGVARETPLPGGCEALFDPQYQQREEDTGNFIEEFSATLESVYPEDDSVIADYRKPPEYFDFDAAYGGYGWEIFYHIPSAIAAGYADGGQYDAALNWLRKIFNPGAEEVWQVLPLRGATAPDKALAFDTGDVINDPDRIASDYPFYYQQATIRHTLQTMLAAGDAAYSEPTQETLQQAKAIYVSARQLFADNLSETLDVLTSEPWPNPSLGEVAVNGYGGFLEPYNQELRSLYDTIESRLSNLRQWLDINGEPLNVPLLSVPIDPRALQRAGKSGLALLSAEQSGDEEDKLALIDFTTVARSAKGYISNLQATSSRLLAAEEKLDAANIGVKQRMLDTNKLVRAKATQDLAVEVAGLEVGLKAAGLAAASSALAAHYGQFLTLLAAQSLVKYGSKTQAYSSEIRNFGSTQVMVALQMGFTKVPTIIGMATGGQHPEATQIANILKTISGQVGTLNVKAATNEADDIFRIWRDATLKGLELGSKVAQAELEMQKAVSALKKERKEQENKQDDIDDFDELKTLIESSLTNQSFYRDLVVDLKLLFNEEWAATQEFCRLLIALYEDETGETNGSSFLTTATLGDGVKKYNAPSRLALDVERLETAYVRSLMAQQSQTAEMSFALSELSTPEAETSALTALLDQGEAYFDLSDDMFDTFYPGQFDRRIQSVRIRFPGLAKAGLNPHARLTQIANTRYLTRERDRSKGAKIRKNRYALQSIVVSGPEVDTAKFAYPEGSLKQFQNTGVESRWHLVLPAVQALRSRSGKERGKLWRDAVSQHIETLRPHLDEIEFVVNFSGRW